MPLHDISSFESRRPKSQFDTFAMEGEAPPAPEMDPAELIAAQGNLTDDSVGHLTTGEIVIPVEALQPELLMQLEKSFQDAGLDLQSYVVGSGQEHVNEKTGMPEFAAQPGIGPGAQNRGSLLGRVTSQNMMDARQRELQQMGGQTQSAAPAEMPTYNDRDVAHAGGGMAARLPQSAPRAPGGGSLSRLQQLFTQAQQKRSGATPYQIPLKRPGAMTAIAPPAAAAPAAPVQREYVGNVPVLTAQENAAAILEDAAKFPQVYAGNPRLAQQLAEAQAMSGVNPAAAAPSAPAAAAPAAAAPAQPPLQSKRHITQMPAAGMEKFVKMSPPKAATPLGGMEAMYADFTGKQKQTTPAAQPDVSSQIGASNQREQANSSLSKVSSAESTPSTAASTTSDSTGTSASDESKTNRLADVSSSDF